MWGHTVGTEKWINPGCMWTVFTFYFKQSFGKIPSFSKSIKRYKDGGIWFGWVEFSKCYFSSCVIPTPYIITRSSRLWAILRGIVPVRNALSRWQKETTIDLQISSGFQREFLSKKTRALHSWSPHTHTSPPCLMKLMIFCSGAPTPPQPRADGFVDAT